MARNPFTFTDVAESFNGVRKGGITSSLARFYGEKSILPTWTFEVTLSSTTRLKRLELFHVVDVVVPSYQFKAESTLYGAVPKTFPVLDHEGFSVRVTYEDDRNGTVLQLVQEMQKTIIKENGLYNTLNNVAIGDLSVRLRNYYGDMVCRWECKDVYFRGADDVSLSYTNNDSLKFAINYGCDIIKFYKY